MERWKKIVGFENYSVSTEGRVRNDKTRRILKPRQRPNGYFIVELLGKDFYIHRLVAIAFIPNPNNYPVVNHKNEVKNDNHVENLEWCTVSYNNTFGKRLDNVKSNQPFSKKCIIDGIVYDSIGAAQRHFDFPIGSLHSMLVKGYTTYKGHTISYC